MSFNNGEIPASEKELLYDLRQTFVIIVTEIKKEIAIARLTKNFTAWYDLLDSLYIEVIKNLSPEEIKEYELLREKSTSICRKHHLTYLKKDTEHSAVIYEALRNLDIWLNIKMNEKNMYGSKEIDDATGL